MRVFAWSDLHLENRSNFELVKQYCKLHAKRCCSASPENPSKCDTSTSATRCSSSCSSNERKDPRSADPSASADVLHIDDSPLRHSTFSESFGKLWEALKGPLAPVGEHLGQDVLILAGDVHYDLEGLKESLELFRSVFGHVAFVPGNHELWVTQKDKDSGIGDSVQKLDRILYLCDSLGVHTRPFSPSKGVRVVPLLSWYDEFDPQFCRAAISSLPQPIFRPLGAAAPLVSGSGFSTRASSPRYGSRGPFDHQALMTFSENWMDYSACKWPHPLANNDPRAVNQSVHVSRHTRREPEIDLARRFNEIRLEAKQCAYPDADLSPAVPPSIIVTPASPPRLGGDTNETPPGSETSSKSRCVGDTGSKLIHKPSCATHALLPSCSGRRTTDSIGMPLSLSDFFAYENKRRGCFVPDISINQEELPQRQASKLRLATVPAADSHDGATNNKQKNEAHSFQSSQEPQAKSAGPPSASPPEENSTHNPRSCEENKPPVVITFSHFLPRAELATIYPLTPSALAYVMGSNLIDEQLRQASSSLHVFGHSHLNVDKEIEGVRYIQHSLGRPSEQKWFPDRRKPKIIFEAAS